MGLIYKRDPTGHVDFFPIENIRGIFLANYYDNYDSQNVEDYVKTVITYNKVIFFLFWQVNNSEGWGMDDIKSPKSRFPREPNHMRSMFFTFTRSS
jgi:hypothetical protein